MTSAIQTPELSPPKLYAAAFSSPPSYYFDKRNTENVSPRKQPGTPPRVKLERCNSPTTLTGHSKNVLLGTHRRGVLAFCSKTFPPTRSTDAGSPASKQEHRPSGASVLDESGKAGACMFAAYEARSVYGFYAPLFICRGSWACFRVMFPR